MATLLPLPVEILDKVTTYMNCTISFSDLHSSDPTIAFSNFEIIYGKLLEIIILFHTLYSDDYNCSSLHMAFLKAIVKILNILNQTIHVRLHLLSYLSTGRQVWQTISGTSFLPLPPKIKTTSQLSISTFHLQSKIYSRKIISAKFNMTNSNEQNQILLINIFNSDDETIPIEPAIESALALPSSTQVSSSPPNSSSPPKESPSPAPSSS